MDIYRFNSRDKPFLSRMLGFGIGATLIINSLVRFYFRNGLPEKMLVIILLGALAFVAIIFTNLFLCELKSYLRKEDFYLSIKGEWLFSKSLSFQGESEIDLSRVLSYTIKCLGKKQLLKLVCSNGKKQEVFVMLTGNDPRIDVLREQLDLVIEQN